MSKEDRRNVDLSGFDVVIDRPIWLGSRIWEPKLYTNPPTILLDCARSQFGTDGAVVHFIKDGRRANPFSKATMVDTTIPPEPEYDIDDEDDEDLEVDTGDGIGEEVDADGEGEDEEVAIDFEFKSPAEFASLGKNDQYEYMESIRNAPEELSEEQSVEYEVALRPVLDEYLKVVSGVKAKEVIEEVLAEYEE